MTDTRTRHGLHLVAGGFFLLLAIDGTNLFTDLMQELVGRRGWGDAADVMTATFLITRLLVLIATVTIAVGLGRMGTPLARAAFPAVLVWASISGVTTVLTTLEMSAVDLPNFIMHVWKLNGLAYLVGIGLSFTAILTAARGSHSAAPSPVLLVLFALGAGIEALLMLLGWLHIPLFRLDSHLAMQLLWTLPGMLTVASLALLASGMARHLTFGAALGPDPAVQATRAHPRWHLAAAGLRTYASGAKAYLVVMVIGIVLTILMVIVRSYEIGKLLAVATPLAAVACAAVMTSGAGRYAGIPGASGARDLACLFLAVQIGSLVVLGLTSLVVLLGVAGADVLPFIKQLQPVGLALGLAGFLYMVWSLRRVALFLGNGQLVSRATTLLVLAACLAAFPLVSPILVGSQLAGEEGVMLLAILALIGFAIVILVKFFSLVSDVSGEMLSPG
jgi:hypothetical protein